MHIRVTHILAPEAALWRGTVRVETREAAVNRVTTILPPSALLPSFSISIEEGELINATRTMATFRRGSKSLTFNYRCYLPATRTFYALGELLPQVVAPSPESFALDIHPKVTSFSLQAATQVRAADAPAGFTCRVDNARPEAFYSTLVSFTHVTNASDVRWGTAIELFASPRCPLSALELLDLVGRIWKGCVDMLGPSMTTDIKVFVDVSTDGNPAARTCWNKGGVIYLTCGVSGTPDSDFLLALSHELLHEWNRSRLVAQSREEWWILEGVAELLAYQVLARSGLVDAARLAESLHDELSRQVDIGADGGPATGAVPTSSSSFPLVVGLERRLRDNSCGRSGIAPLIQRMGLEAPRGRRQARHLISAAREEMGGLPLDWGDRAVPDSAQLLALLSPLYPHPS